MLEPRHEQLDAHADRRAPAPLSFVGVAARGEVARQHAAVCEVLRREPELRRDDERLEQRLGDRVAEEEVAILGLDGNVDPERREQLPRLGRRGHDDRVGSLAVDEPPVAVLTDRVHLRMPHVDARGERLDDCLRPVEVAVLAAPRAAEDRVGAQAWHQVGRFVGDDHARRNPLCVLHADVRGEALERRPRLGDEEVAALVQRQWDARPEPLGRLAPEGDRLGREPARDGRPPLLAHTPRLHARGTRADSRALEHKRVVPARLQLARNGETCDPGSDNEAAHPPRYSLAMSDVTFLFTDIERSTGLLARLGDAYGGVLERHRELLTDAVTAGGGRIVDARGDELFAVFPTAGAGIDAALAAQRALNSAEWPDDATVRVRMGLHTGRAQTAGDAYFGLAVHHAARVAQAAHGAQVIASEATVTADELPHVTATDLGEYDLRGIPRPTRLFQLTTADLPSVFPPPNATPSRPAPPRVALADDSVLLREGIAALLEESGFEVTGQACTGDDLLDVVDATLPDVAIVDIRMPPTNTDEGIRAAAEIKRRYPRMGVLLLSQHIDVENALELFGGADPTGIGYLLKERVADVDEFIAAVQRVNEGGVAIDATIFDELRSGLWPAHAQTVLERAAGRS